MDFFSKINKAPHKWNWQWNSSSFWNSSWRWIHWACDLRLLRELCHLVNNLFWVFAKVQALRGALQGRGRGGGGTDTWRPPSGSLSARGGDWHIKDVLNNHLKDSRYVLCYNSGAHNINVFYKCWYLRAVHLRPWEGRDCSNEYARETNGCLYGTKAKCRVQSVIKYSHAMEESFSKSIFKEFTCIPLFVHSFC